MACDRSGKAGARWRGRYQSDDNQTRVYRDLCDRVLIRRRARSTLRWDGASIGPEFDGADRLLASCETIGVSLKKECGLGILVCFLRLRPPWLSARTPRSAQCRMPRA